MKIEAVYKDYKRINDICIFLSRYFTTGDAQRWKKLFRLSWEIDAPCGYVMYNELHEVVGFIGTVYAQREINNSEILTCSLTSWAMDESTRGKGLSLIRSFIKEQNTLFLDLTANEPSRKIFNAFKFVSLESYEYIVPVFFSINKFRSIEFNHDIDSSKLSKTDDKIMRDHQESCVKFVKFTYNTNYVLIGYIEVKRKHLPFLEILSVSGEEDILSRYLFDMLKYLAYREKKLGSIIDSRFTNKNAESVFFKRKIQNKIFKYNGEHEISIKNIDMLYTEKVIFCQ